MQASIPYVLKRQASAPAHLPTVSAPSTVAAPPSPAVTDGCQCKGPVGIGEAFVSFTTGTKDNVTSQTPWSKSAARKQLFTCDNAAGDFFEEEDDQEMATMSSQAEEQLPQAAAASRGSAPAPPALWTPGPVFQQPAELLTH
ncbi:hypothetical protein CRENBAI_007023 [Crenichthys baileyi]|uniref:Uncharacterized protein n=1 Tax=Crenichthys baileyi TaxID=28760 RepID=A0AAV9RTY1_9TELE